MPKDERKFWGGSDPVDCDFCGKRLKDVFVDCATATGWGMACPKCHKAKGYGLGVGRGQRYQRLDDDRWLKIVETTEPKPLSFLEKIKTDSRPIEF